MSGDDLIEVDGVIFAETSLAWGARFVPMGSDEAVDIWIPKSQGEYLGRGQWLIPHWLARKHDLI